MERLTALSLPLCWVRRGALPVAPNLVLVVVLIVTMRVGIPLARRAVVVALLALGVAAVENHLVSRNSKPRRTAVRRATSMRQAPQLFRRTVRRRAV